MEDTRVVRVALEGVQWLGTTWEVINVHHQSVVSTYQGIRIHHNTVEQGAVSLNPVRTARDIVIVTVGE